MTIHLTLKQILVNACVILKNKLTNEEIVRTINKVEEKIKEVEPKVDMIFLETASLRESDVKKLIQEHIR